MVKLIILLSFLLMVLPLASYAAPQPTSLEKVMQQAGISGRPVEQKSEDGMIHKAYPDYGKSKCRVVHGSTLKEGKLIEKRIVEVCNRDFKLPVPYLPHHMGR